MYEKCILVEKHCTNRVKRVYFYAEDIDDDGVLYFQVEYNTEYSNGTSQDGNSFIELDKVLNEYSMDYPTLKEYLVRKYQGNENAFKEIISEMEEKGLELNTDENESEYF